MSDIDREINRLLQQITLKTADEHNKGVKKNEDRKEKQELGGQRGNNSNLQKLEQEKQAEINVALINTTTEHGEQTLHTSPITAHSTFVASSLDTSLSGIQCCFTWPLELHNCGGDDLLIAKLNSKLISPDHENLYLIGILLALSRELCVAKLYEEALNHLTNAVSIAEKFRKDAKRGIMHVILGNHCFILKAMNQDCTAVLSKIISYSDLTDKEKAYVCGLHGVTFLHYDDCNFLTAKAKFKEAVKMDCVTADWWMGIGRASMRLRHLCSRFSLPSAEEEEAFEKALQLEPDNVRFKVFLAQNKIEKSHHIFGSKSTNWKQVCKALNQDAKKLFEEVAASETQNVSSLVRCADGLRKLPRPWKDIEASRKCILQAVRLSPQDSHAQHKAGCFYESQSETALAKHHYKMAVESSPNNVPAQMSILRMKLRLDRDVDPLVELRLMLEVCHNPESQVEILAQEGLCHMEQRNLRAAVDCWVNAFAAANNDTHLKSVHNMFVRGDIVNVYSLLVKGLRSLLETDLPEETRVTYRELLGKVSATAGRTSDTDHVRKQSIRK